MSAIFKRYFHCPFIMCFILFSLSFFASCSLNSKDAKTTKDAADKKEEVKEAVKDEVKEAAKETTEKSTKVVADKKEEVKEAVKDEVKEAAKAIDEGSTKDAADKKEIPVTKKAVKERKKETAKDSADKKAAVKESSKESAKESTKEAAKDAAAQSAKDKTKEAAKDSTVDKQSAENSSLPDFTDFSLPNLKNKTFDTKDLRKDKWAIVKFGASWCPPCRFETAEFLKLQPTLEEDKITIIEISVEAMADAKKYHAATKATWTNLVDENGVAGRIYNLSAIPRLIIVNKDGKIVYNESGALPEKKIKEILEEKGFK